MNWDFLDRNQDTLQGNPRLNQIYATGERMKDDTKDETRRSAAAILEKLDKGKRV